MSKRRPALVVQAGRLGADLPQTIVAMITSNMDRAGHLGRIIVMVGSRNRERIRSVDGLRDPTILPLFIIRRSIAPFTGLKEIDAALRKTLAL